MTRAELTRRGMEGELQRLKLALNDKETENQVRRRQQGWLVEHVCVMKQGGHSGEERLDVAC